MDHEPVLLGIDVRHAGVVSLEMQTGRRDDAEEVLQRSEGDRRIRRARQSGAFATLDVGCERGRHTVGRRQDRRAERLAPFGHIGRQVLRWIGRGTRRRTHGKRRGSPAQELTPRRVRRWRRCRFRRRTNATGIRPRLRHLSPPSTATLAGPSMLGQRLAANSSRSFFSGCRASMRPAICTQTPRQISMSSGSLTR